MTSAPDTLVLTGPNFEQDVLNNALVTPTGSIQMTLRNALALGSNPNLSSPTPIGSTTPNTGAFTLLNGQNIGATSNGVFIGPGSTGGSGQLAANATGPFLYIPFVNATPTGTPATNGLGVPILWDNVLKTFRVFAGSQWQALPTLLAAQSWTGTQSFSQVSSARSTVNLTGGQSGQIAGNVSAATGTSASQQTWYSFTASNDQATTPTTVNMWSQYDFGGLTYTGAAGSLFVTLNQNSATAPALITNFYQTSNFFGTLSFNAGGTSSSVTQGSLYGINNTQRLRTGATFMRELVGQENDTEIQTGASARDRVNIKLILSGSHAVQGTSLDAMLSMGRGSTATVGSRYGILLNEANNFYAMDNANGTIMGRTFATIAANAAANPISPFGIDLYNIAFSTAAWRGPGMGSTIDGNNYLSLGSTKMSWGAVGLSIDPTGYVYGVAGGTLAIATGGNGYADQQIVTTQVGGLFYANVTSGAITSLTIIVPPSTTAASAPSTTTYNVLADGIHTVSATVTLTSGTWTAAKSIQLAPSGGSLQVGSGMFTANGAVAATLTSLGPTGSHTTVQEWLTVTNASGAVRYIPAY